jgi:DNA-binding transcriptional LysR family regulator
LDTRLLDRFVAVVELGSLNRAAQKLNLSQPALSKSIQTLEDSLAVSLLTRGPRGIAVTAFGQSVYAYAKVIGTELRKMHEEIGAVRDLTLGTVNLGTPPGNVFTSNVLAAGIQRLARKGRRLTINSRVGPREHLLKPLLLGELDFIITVLTDTLPNELAQEQLYEDPLIFVVKPEHMLAKGRAVDIGDLVRFPLVVPDDQAHDSLQRLAASQHYTLEQPVMRCNASNLIKAVLVAGDFVALVREDMARLDLRSGEIAKLSLSKDLSTKSFLAAQRMGLVYRSNTALPRASQALMDEIRSFYIKTAVKTKRIAGAARSTSP